MHEEFQKTRDISDAICCYMRAVVRRRKNMFRALLCQVATACALKILSEIVGVQDGRPQQCGLTVKARLGKARLRKLLPNSLGSY